MTSRKLPLLLASILALPMLASATPTSAPGEAAKTVPVPAPAASGTELPTAAPSTTESEAAMHSDQAKAGAPKKHKRSATGARTVKKGDVMVAPGDEGSASKTVPVPVPAQ